MKHTYKIKLYKRRLIFVHIKNMIAPQEKQRFVPIYSGFSTS